MLFRSGIGARIPAYEAALKANAKKYQLFVYEGANHGFHNDTTPRYDEAAAKLAWQRTLDFFNQNPTGIETSITMPIGTRLFQSRVRLLGHLQDQVGVG